MINIKYCYLIDFSNNVADVKYWYCYLIDFSGNVTDVKFSYCYLINFSSNVVDIKFSIATLLISQAMWSILNSYIAVRRDYIGCHKQDGKVIIIKKLIMKWSNIMNNLKEMISKFQIIEINASPLVAIRFSNETWVPCVFYWDFILLRCELTCISYLIISLKIDCVTCT